MRKGFIGDEPFAVMLGDDVVDAQVPCLKQLMDAFAEHQANILGVKEVDRMQTDKYGIVDGEYKNVCIESNVWWKNRIY